MIHLWLDYLSDYVINLHAMTRGGYKVDEFILSWETYGDEIELILRRRIP